jgi:uncharacterized cofD-like protein
MVALSQDETLLAKLFDFRFESGRGLKGHSFGNLFLTAMTHLTGDFAQAVKFSAEVLAVAGHIYPSTASNVSLEATLEDGQVVAGESRIGRSKQRIERIHLRPKRVKPLKEALEAIAKADVITLGPGSLFTSLIPNLLVEGIPRAIVESRATKVYFANLMTQPGETQGFSVSEHLEAILKHCGRHRRGLIDACVVNWGTLGSGAVRAYGAKAAKPVTIDYGELERLGVRVISENLVRLSGQRHQSKIRHDSSAIGAITVELAQASRLTQSRKRKK